MSNYTKDRPPILSLTSSKTCRLSPFKITHVVTDNAAQFTYNLLAEHLKPKDKQHVFDAVCQALTIEHRTTQFRHPWTNGQVEVTNKMLKQATTKTYHYKDINSLKKHLMAYVLYYNHQKPLKSKKFKTPWQLIELSYTISPQSFLFNHKDKIAGLNRLVYIDETGIDTYIPHTCKKS